MICAALSGCPEPKERDRDSGAADGPAAVDGGKKEAGKGKDAAGEDSGKGKDAGKKEAGKGKDAAQTDSGKTDAPIPTDSAAKCDSKAPPTTAGKCKAGQCSIEGVCYNAGDPKGDLYKTCKPTWSMWHWYPKKGGVVTFAGGDKQGHKDGPAYDALFNDPRGLVVDAAGTVYVADSENCVVRVISNGQVSTIGVKGSSIGQTCKFKDGSYATAHFNTVTDLVLGKGGEIFATDSESDRIRVISCGQVRTFAGYGSCGTTNDPKNPKGAYFCYPEGIATDGAGVFYVSEFSNHMVRKVTQSSVSLLAGTDWKGSTPQKGYQDGPGVKALFNALGDISIGPGGLVLVAERLNHVIRQIDPVTKQVSLFAGTKPKGTGVYTNVTTQPGCADSTDPLKAKFNQPEALVYDPTRKRIYVWGGQTNCLRQIQLPGKAVSTVNGKCASNGILGDCAYQLIDGELYKAGFNGPEGLFVDKAGLLWVADSGNDAIRIINPK